jgi:hypothetical protein
MPRDAAPMSPSPYMIRPSQPLLLCRFSPKPQRTCLKRPCKRAKMQPAGYLRSYGRKSIQGAKTITIRTQTIPPSLSAPESIFGDNWRSLGLAVREMKSRLGCAQSASHSGRFCSTACRSFFVCQAEAAQESPDRDAMDSSKCDAGFHHPGEDALVAPPLPSVVEPFGGPYSQGASHHRKPLRLMKIIPLSNR